MGLLPVSALKNWLYCPRSVYYQQVLGLKTPPTAKMREGKAAQEVLERLETRRTLARYGVADRERVFHARLSSERLGLSGCPDLLLVASSVVSVVEFKLTAAEPNDSHWVQLAAYAVLVEDQRHDTVDQVVLYRVPDEAVFAKRFHDGWRSRLNQLLEEVRRCVESARIPEACSDSGHCVDCEYANFCADVW